MRRLAGKAVAAAAGGVLVLSLAVTAPEEQRETPTVDWESATLEESDVDGQGFDDPDQRCADNPGGYQFYPGYTQSEAYNDRFEQVGDDDQELPYLEAPDEPVGTYWTPQGLSYWADWDGQGNDLLLVGAYNDDRESIIYGIDPDTGEWVGTVKVEAGHLGGIVVFGDYAYVSGSTEHSRSIRRYDLGELREGLLENGLTFVDFYKEDSVEHAAWLGTDGESLYSGDYQRIGDQEVPTMRRYVIIDDGEAWPVGETYVTPLGTQGMTVVDGDFYFSVAPEYEADGGLQSYIYRVNEDQMSENAVRWDDFDPVQTFTNTSYCYTAPSMAEGIAWTPDEVYLAFESGSQKFDHRKPDNQIEHIHVGQLGDNDPDDGNDGDLSDSTTTYTGPTESDFHDQFTASARLADGDGPVSGAQIDFALGSGGGSQSCTATTGSDGVAACGLTPTQRPGPTTLTASFGGSSDLASSRDTVPFTISKQETELRYTGPERVANGTPTELSGVLTEETRDGPPVADRSVTLSLGEGDDRQSCDAVTDADGEATCEIESVDQPLNDDATVPVGLSFDGDDYYESSSAKDTVLLEYYTGRAYGLSAEVDVLDLGAGVEPTPDTGPIRTADATENDAGCVAEVSTLVVSADSVCPQVTTSLAPGTSRSTTSVQNAEIGLPGLPVIEIEGATSRSTSTCDAGGSAEGSTDLTLRVGGEQVEITGEANAEVDLGGAASLVVNEQEPVPGADHGLTVNAVHLTAADGAVDIVIASATSDVHNCVE